MRTLGAGFQPKRAGPPPVWAAPAAFSPGLPRITGRSRSQALTVPETEETPSHFPKNTTYTCRKKRTV